MKTGNRTPLHQVLPLEMPYLVQIFPAYACNFKCAYCLHGLPRGEHGYISHKPFMDFELYRGVIDDIAAAGWRLKMLRFAAIGEPLLHPEIADMVAYAVKKQVADTVDIVTNASLLTEALADKLIEAGLSTLRVSLEGLSAEEYAENCGTRVDFERMKVMLAYYSDRCVNSRVYIKIIDYMLRKDAGRERLFYDTFAPISHSIAIEHLTPTIEGIDYSKLSDGAELSLTQEGNQIQNVNICPQPFYMIQVNPDGNLVPCCSMRYPAVFENVAEMGLVRAWNGDLQRQFRIAMLGGVGDASPVCAKCTLYKYGIHDEDVLDGHEGQVLNRFKELGAYRA